jgi:predicted nucleic acid-binding protein
MTTAVDSSVLYDLILADPRFGPLSRIALDAARANGSVIACEVVWAEVAARFGEARGAAAFFDELGIQYQPLNRQTALAAGALWGDYRNAGGPRQRIIADFLVGAHALHQAHRLLTRDRGLYRAYFAELEIFDPTK